MMRGGFVRQSRQDGEQRDGAYALRATRTRVDELGQMLRGLPDRDLAALEEQCGACDTVSSRMLQDARDDVLKSARRADAMLDEVSRIICKLAVCMR